MTHNGKDLQASFWFPEVARDYRYLNHIKYVQDAFHNSAGGGWGPDIVNENGYPITSDPGVYQAIMTVTPLEVYSGNWVLKWTGEATFLLSGNVTVSGSLSGVDGRWVGTITPTQDQSYDLTTLRNRCIFQISSINASNPPTDIVLVREDQEAFYDAGEIWSPHFLSMCRNFGTLRFLDDQRANTSHQTFWSHRIPVDAMSYYQSFYSKDLPYGVTTGGSNAYSLAGLTSSPVHGQMAHLKFHENATDAFTINGIEVIGKNGGDLAAGSSGLPTADRWGTITYCADLGKWLKYAGDGLDFNKGMPANIPPEHLVDLCNQVGAHPWIHIPTLAGQGTGVSGNSTSDYVDSFAAYMRDNLDNGLVPVVEYGNEVFNGFSGFWHGPIISKIATEKSYSVAETQGRGLSLIGEAFETVYAGSGKSYDLIASMQTYGSTSVWLEQLDAPSWVADGGNAPTDYVTKAGVTSYWGTNSYSGSYQPSLGQVFSNFLLLLDDARAHDVGDAAQKTAAIERYWRMSTFLPKREELIAQIEIWQTALASYSLPIVAYEGGYSPDFFTFDPAQRITSITKGNPTIIGLSDGHSFAALDTCTFRGITQTGGSAHELAGNTYDVLSVTDTTITIDVDSTSMGDLLYGGDVNSWGSFSAHTGVIYDGFATKVNVFLRETKFHQAIRTHQIEVSLGCEAVGLTKESMYFPTGVTGAWGHIDPHIFADPTLMWMGKMHYQNFGYSGDFFKIA